MLQPKTYRNAWQKAQSLSKPLIDFAITSQPHETKDTAPPIQYNMEMYEEDEAELIEDDMSVVSPCEHNNTWQSKSVRPKRRRVHVEEVTVKKNRVEPEWTINNDEEITQKQTLTNVRRERSVPTR